MRIDADFYFDKNEIDTIIHRLAELKENIETTNDTSALDDAVSVLYEILEEAEEYDTEDYDIEDFYSDKIYEFSKEFIRDYISINGSKSYSCSSIEYIDEGETFPAVEVFLNSSPELFSMAKNCLNEYGATDENGKFGFSLLIEGDPEGHKEHFPFVNRFIYCEILAPDRSDICKTIHISFAYENDEELLALINEKCKISYNKDINELLEKAKTELEKEQSDFLDMEIGNLLFGHSRGEYRIPDREAFQNIFEKLLDCGFDSYGYIEDEELERKYGRILESGYKNADIYPEGYNKELGEPDYHPHLHYFDNGTFMMNPYYWGDAEDLCEFPNFIYYPENIVIRWYKYPFRDSYSNLEISEEKFREIVEKCIKSLKEES